MFADLDLILATATSIFGMAATAFAVFQLLELFCESRKDPKEPRS